MRRWIIISCLLAAPAVAQEAPSFFERLLGTDRATNDAEQGTLLEELLEDSLSGAGRRVSVTGFRGALSGQATLDELTIADDEGVWLTLRDATLDWNRAALFAGRLEVDELSAAEILLPRLSSGEPAPTPEATAFQLPDLPVSVDIGRLAAERVELGEDILGIATSVSVEGALSLGDGDGAADVAIRRRDGDGALTLDAGYSNTTGRLRLDLSLQEAAGGILATLTGLPGTPSVDFNVTGDAPLDNFIADIRLATDGAERLDGQVSLSETDEARRIAARISGDIAPVFAPAYRDFFGDRIALVTSAFLFPDGRISLPVFALRAQEIQLSGSLDLDSNRLPERIALTGEIAPENGTSVLLPLAGEETRVARADLSIGFDTSQSDDWSADIRVTDLRRRNIAAERLSLVGTGVIEAKNVTAQIAFRGSGVNTGPGLTEALGPDVTGSATINWEGGPVEIPRFALTAQALEATGRARLDDAQVTGDIALSAGRLAGFSTLAGRALTGQANLQTEFTVAPLTGAFDVTAKGTTTDLTVAEPRADAVLQGEAKLDARAVRDADGLRITLSDLSSAAAKLTGAFDLRSGGSTASLAGDLTDAALLVDGLTGPARINFSGREDGARDWAIVAGLEAPTVSANIDGTVSDIYEAPRFAGKIDASAADLSAFASETGRPLTGALTLTAETDASADLSRVTLDATLDGSNLAIGQPDIDRLLTGKLDARLNGAKSDDRIDIADFALTTAALDAEASGTLADAGDELTVRARLADLAPFAPGFNGPLTTTGRIGRSGDTLSLDLQAIGPGGAQADVDGTLAEDASTARLSIDGTAPLALANRFIAPRNLSGTARFDLELSGPLRLSSLSGRVSTSGARLAAPTLGNALDDVGGEVTLGGGQAELDLAARVDSGGRLTVSGPIGLAAPNSASLAIDLNNVRLTDNRIFETTADGRIGVNGALAGGARIAGRVDLGETNVQIPNSTVGGTGPIPEIVHINEPPPVRGTRRKAGFLGRNGNGADKGGASYPLDVQINAPNRIFIRGRGLDAELGGALRLTGTTRNIVPLGAFNLIRGRLDILGRRLDLEEARITIQGALVPFLNIRANTDAEGTDINVEVFGPADNPEIRFSSSPELPQEEVLARLIFGRGLETLSPLQAARLALAVRTLAGQGGEGLVGRLRGEAGLADLDVTTDEDGNAAVRAGAYLGENVYSDVTVDSEGETQLNLNLDVGRSLTVRGGVTNQGETSLGIFFERDY